MSDNAHPGVDPRPGRVPAGGSPPARRHRLMAVPRRMVAWLRQVGAPPVQPVSAGASEAHSRTPRAGVLVLASVAVLLLLLIPSSTGIAAPGPSPTPPSSSPGPAALLIFGVQPSDTLPGAPISPAVTVQVEDQFGYLVTTDASTVTLAIGTNPASGNLSGTLTVSAIGGVATFSDLSIDALGTGYTLVATDGGLVSATSQLFNIVLVVPTPSPGPSGWPPQSPPPTAAPSPTTPPSCTAGSGATPSPAPGPATQLVFGVQPSDTLPGATIQPAVTVQVENQLCNLVTTDTSAVSLALGTGSPGGTLNGTLAVAAIGGVATFGDLSIASAGTGYYTLVATDGSLTPATSQPFSILTSVQVVTPQGTSVPVTPVNANGSSAPVSLTFDTVAVGGTTTVATTTTAPTTPAGYTLPGSPTYFDVSTTATVSGNITVCFSYAGITPAPTQLLHYDSHQGTWVDITTTNDTVNGVICGVTISLSPFALATRTPLTVTAVNQAKAYGAALPTFSVTYTYAGLVTGNEPDGVGGTLALSTSATAASPVGTYPITPSGLTSSGYAITPVAGTLTVTKAPLSVIAPSPSRAYGAANPSLMPSYTGFVNGDKATSLTTQPTCSTTATTASPVGTYPVTCTGGASSNYAITYVAGTLTIAIPDRYVTPLNTTLTVTAPGILALTGGSVSSITITKAPQGSLTMQTSGAFTYIPKSGFSGTDTFAFRATVNGTLAPAVTVTIYVLGKGMNCAGCNLSGLSANGLTLTGSNLAGANLTGTSLVNANLSGANLSAIVATGVTLNGATLTGANLASAAMSGATLVRANLTGANVSKANLSNANLSSSNFAGANLSYANLKGATTAGANFTGANLTGVIR